MIKYLFIIFIASTSIAESPKPFKIGVIAALSGQVANFGVAIKNGFELSHQKYSNVTYLFEDDQYNPTLSISAYRKLRQSKVDLIFVAGVAPSMAVAPLAEKDKFPLIVNCQSLLPISDRKYIISSVNPTTDYVHLLWQELKAKGVERIGIIEAESPYIAAYVNELISQSNNPKLVTVVASVSTIQNDFRSIIASTKSRELDALGVLLFPGQVREFYKQMKQLNLNIQTFGTDVMESHEEQLLAGDSMSGALYVTNVIDPDFAKKYELRFFNTEQISTAANSFEMGLLLHDIFSTNPSSSEELILKLQSIKNRSSILGSFSYVKNDKGVQYFKFPLRVVVVKKM